jgi:hypothetical protein
MRSPVFRSVLLACAVAAAPARAVAQQPLAELPVTSLSNLVIVQGSIGDSRPLWILLDTGAGRTAVDAPLVDSLGLRVTGQGWAQGAAGRAPMRVLGDVPVRLGGVDLPLSTAFSLPFADLEPALGMDVDAVVGQELFARFVVQIDYGAGVLRLYDPATFVAPAAPSVPLEVVRGEAFVRVRVTVDGRTVDARLQLDTGSGGALTLDAPFVRAHGLAAGPGLSGAAAWGVGGRSRQVNRFVERLVIGDVVVEAPVATLSLDTVGVLADGEGEGLLGGDVLSRFTVTLDYGRGRMYLQPNARFGEPFRRALAGMGIFALPPDFRTFRLTYVDEGGVAAAAGLREGDLIQAVDGRPAAELALHELRDLFKVPGAAYTLTIRRGGETMDVRLVLPAP